MPLAAHSAGTARAKMISTISAPTDGTIQIDRQSCVTVRQRPRRRAGRVARRIRRRVPVHHRARYERADEVAHAVRDEVDEPLRRRANPLARLLVRVDLPRDEEEVVADAMQQDPDVDAATCRPRVALAEREVAERPRQHAHEHDHANARAA